MTRVFDGGVASSLPVAFPFAGPPEVLAGTAAAAATTTVECRVRGTCWLSSTLLVLAPTAAAAVEAVEAVSGFLSGQRSESTLLKMGKKRAVAKVKKMANTFVHTAAERSDTSHWRSENRAENVQSASSQGFRFELEMKRFGTYALPMVCRGQCRAIYRGGRCQLPCGAGLFLLLGCRLNRCSDRFETSINKQP